MGPPRDAILAVRKSSVSCRPRCRPSRSAGALTSSVYPVGHPRRSRGPFPCAERTMIPLTVLAALLASFPCPCPCPPGGDKDLVGAWKLKDGKGILAPYDLEFAKGGKLILTAANAKGPVGFDITWKVAQGKLTITINGKGRNLSREVKVVKVTRTEAVFEDPAGQKSTYARQKK